MGKGFSSIAVDGPKEVKNLGGILRAAGNYRSKLVVLGNSRINPKHSADTMKIYRHMPLIRVDDVLDAIPFGAVPVAVDLIDGAIPLPEYTHPKRAYYIFGAEDRTLGARITDRCKDVIYVPTNRCMNLAAAVTVVLYDRMVKVGGWESEEVRGMLNNEIQAAE